VLEIGAAGATEGASARYLAEHGAAAVVSIDSDAAAIEGAAAACKHPFVKFLRADPSSLPRGTFDLAILVDGGAFAGDPDRVAELKALLSPGGLLVAALPAAGGAGLPALAGTRPPTADDTPPYEAFHTALAAHFAVVEIATQSAMVGYVLAAAGAADGREPLVVLDGSLAGTDEAAYYLAVCGSRPSGLTGLTLVALPPRPLADAAVENAEAAKARAPSAGAPALDAPRLAELEAEGAAARERAEALHGDLAREREARSKAEAALERLRESEERRERESEETRAAISRQASEVERAREERDQATVRLEEARARLQQAEASAQAALVRAEEAEARCTEAERTLEDRAAELARAQSAEIAQSRAELEQARSAELDRARGAEAAAAAALASAAEHAAALTREVEHLRAELSARQVELDAARLDAASTGGEMLAEREALREEARIQQARGVRAEERAAEALARHAEVEARLTSESERTHAAEERLRQVLQKARTAEARLAQAEARAAELAAEAARSTDEARGHASAYAAQAEPLHRLREEMPRLRSQVALLEAQLRQVAEERGRAEAQATEARNAAEETQARAAALEAEVQATRRERDESERRLGEAMARVSAEPGEEATRLRQELDARSAELDELREQATARRAELDDLRQQATAHQAATAERARRLEELEASLAEARRSQADAEAAGAETAARIRQGDQAAAALRQQLGEERSTHLAAVADRDERISRLQQDLAEAAQRAERNARQIEAGDLDRRAALSGRRWVRAGAIAAAAMMLLALGFALGRRRAPDAARTAGAVATAGVPAGEMAGARAPIGQAPVATAGIAPGGFVPAPPLALATPMAEAASPAASCSCPLILHEVRPGDRLWDLSAHYYRDPFKWRRLFRENRDHVADPDVIFPGQQIRVPDPRPPAAVRRRVHPPP